MGKLFEQVIMRTNMVHTNAIHIAAMVAEMTGDVRVASRVTTKIVTQAHHLVAQGVPYMRVTWMDSEIPLDVFIESLYTLPDPSDVP